MLCAVAVGSLLVAEATRNAPLRRVSKSLASLCFIGVGLAALHGSATDYDVWMLAGLVLGAIGDVALLFTGKRAFLAGLGSFLLGHAAYAVAFSRIAPPVEWSSVVAVALALVGALVLFWLWPRLGSLRGPVVAYVVVIATMVVAALAAPSHSPGRGIRIAVGAALFAASDLAVARERFVVDAFANKLWGLPTYYAGQLCLAWSIGVADSP